MERYMTVEQIVRLAKAKALQKLNAQWAFTFLLTIMLTIL
jgi:hypothetical protein